MSEILVSPTVMDLGIIDASNPRSFEYNVTNLGYRELGLSVAASCGCSVPSIEPALLAPGQGGKVKVTFDPLGKSGMQEKSIWVSYDDPIKGKQVTTVTFRAQIKSN